MGSSSKECRSYISQLQVTHIPSPVVLFSFEQQLIVDCDSNIQHESGFPTCPNSRPMSASVNVDLELRADRYTENGYVHASLAVSRSLG